MGIYLVLSGLRLSNGLCFINSYEEVLQFAELQRPENISIKCDIRNEMRVK